MKFLYLVKKTANKILGPLGSQIVRKDERAKNLKHFLPLVETLRNAEKAGLSLGDYIEARHDLPRSSQETIDNIAKLGVFGGRILTACEVGPGSGRYLEKTIRMCSPEKYEIYETAVEWRDWLVKNYGVIPRHTDGLTLLETETGSIDLVQAHKILSAIPLFEIMHYFSEFARVSRQGGKLVFDIITENCMHIESEDFNIWMSGNYGWPHTMIPKQFAIKYFCDRGFSFDGSFIVSMKPLITECFVFTNSGKCETYGERQLQ